MEELLRQGGGSNAVTFVFFAALILGWVGLITVFWLLSFLFPKPKIEKPVVKESGFVLENILECNHTWVDRYEGNIKACKICTKCDKEMQNV